MNILIRCLSLSALPSSQVSTCTKMMIQSLLTCDSFIQLYLWGNDDSRHQNQWQISSYNSNYYFLRRWDVAQLVRAADHRATDAGLIPCVARDFLPRANFQCRLSFSVHTPLYAIACINICGHGKDPVVYVRVQWIMETLKHPACTLGLVVWLLQLAFSGEHKPNFP